MPVSDSRGLDQRLLRQAFDRAAQRYDRFAKLQVEVADRLLERLDYIRLTPKRIADLGAGTGYCTQRLGKRYRGADLFALDLAMGMLRKARRRGPKILGRPAYVCADMQHLPFASGRLDLIVSNLTLQWCSDLGRTFLTLRNALAPGGLLLFSTFGPDTLQELRDSWSTVDDYVHVNAFPDMHIVGDAMTAAGLRDVVVDVDRLWVTYHDVYELMRELKMLGAHNVNRGRPNSLTGKGRLAHLVAAYERYRRDGGLPATYEVVYGHAWAPAPGPIQVPFEENIHA